MKGKDLAIIGGIGVLAYLLLSNKKTDAESGGGNISIGGGGSGEKSFIETLKETITSPFQTINTITKEYIEGAGKDTATIVERLTPPFVRETVINNQGAPPDDSWFDIWNREKTTSNAVFDKAGISEVGIANGIYGNMNAYELGKLSTLKGAKNTLLIEQGKRPTPDQPIAAFLNTGIWGATSYTTQPDYKVIETDKGLGMINVNQPKPTNSVDYWKSLGIIRGNVPVINEDVLKKEAANPNSEYGKTRGFLYT